MSGKCLEVSGKSGNLYSEGQGKTLDQRETNKIKEAIMTQGTSLEGTEKQIKWAEKIRAEYITLLRKKFSNPDAVESVIMLETSAAWWIDQRDKAMSK